MRGEELARRWLKELGYYVIPISLIENGGAPLLESIIEKVILPDIQAFKDGAPIAVDVKSKGRVARCQKLQRMQTGCAMRHYEAYKRFQKVTGMRTALAFLHADRPDLYLGMLDEIETDAQRWYWDEEWASTRPNHAYKESMIFFNIDPNHGSRFKVCRIRPDIEEWTKFQKSSKPPKTVRPWEGGKRTLPGQGMLPGF